MKQVFGLDIAKYAGKEVISIDGLPAMKYMVGFANKYIGIARDIGTQFNIAFSRPTGTGLLDFGMFAQRSMIPIKNFLTYQIQMT